MHDRATRETMMSTVRSSTWCADVQCRVDVRCDSDIRVHARSCMCSATRETRDARHAMDPVHVRDSRTLLHVGVPHGHALLR